MKNKLKFLLTAVFALVLGLSVLVACAPDEPVTPENTAKVTLDKTTLELDLHEEAQLTATATGTTEAVVWTSSDPSVATVEGGLVKSVKAGSAKVTASAGGASADCAVTVVDSRTAPVFTFDYAEDEIGLEVGGEFSVTAGVTWKGKPVNETVTYMWSVVADEPADVVEIKPEGSKVTLKGLKVGETKVQVAAVVYGTPLVKQFTVRVANQNIRFELTGPEQDETGYKLALGLLETDENHTATPSVTVYNGQTKLENPTITWTVSEGSAVTVSASGTITAVSLGEATVTGACEGNYFTISVSTHRTPVELEERVTFETEVGTVDLSAIKASFDGPITTAEFGADVFGSYDSATGILTFDKDYLPVSAKDLGEDKMLTVGTEKAVYSIPANAYTKILKTAADLDGFGAISKKLGDVSNLWDGYFVLGNDIDYSDGGNTAGYQSFIRYDASWDNDKNFWQGDSGLFDGRYNGFKGVFDGKGHNIDKLHMAGALCGGFIGGIHTDGILRNLSFTHATFDGWCGFVSSWGNGRIENVYVSLDSILTGSLPPPDGVDTSGIFFSRDAMGSARIVKCFAEVKKIEATTGDPNGIIPGFTHEGYGCLQGVYTVGIPHDWHIHSVGDGQKNVYGNYANFSGFAAADIDFSEWENDFWKLENGRPYPKNLTPETVTLPAFEDMTVGVGTRKSLETPWHAILKLDEAATELGVTLEGNTLVIPNDNELVGESFILTMENVYKASESVTATVTIAEGHVITAESRLDLELGRDGENFTIDLTAYDADLNGYTFESALLGDAGLEASGTTAAVTIPKSAFNTLGNGTVTLTFTRGTEEDAATIVIQVPICVVTLVIRDADDLDKMKDLSKAACTEGYFWGGYFVLGNDIEYNHITNPNASDREAVVAQFTRRITPFNNYTSLYQAGVDGGLTEDAGLNGRIAGFKGIFDGRGYNIDGLAIPDNSIASGVFGGVLHSEGVVKNVSFTNVFHNGWGGFLCNGGNGRFENVYVQVMYLGRGDANNFSGIFFAKDTMGDARIKNCFVEVKAVEDQTYISGLGRLHEGFGAIENGYVVGLTNAYLPLTQGTPYATAKAFATRDAMKEANIGITAENGWDMSFWTTDADGLPIPKNLLK